MNHNISTKWLKNYQTKLSHINISNFYKNDKISPILMSRLLMSRLDFDMIKLEFLTVWNGIQMTMFPSVMSPVSVRLLRFNFRLRYNSVSESASPSFRSNSDWSSKNKTSQNEVLKPNILSLEILKVKIKLGFSPKMLLSQYKIQ